MNPPSSITTSAPLISDGGLGGLGDLGEAGLSDYELSWATRSFSPLLGHRLLVKDVSRGNNGIINLCALLRLHQTTCQGGLL